MFLSFHSARFIMGDFPQKPIESHAGCTQKGGVYMIEVSRENFGPSLGHWSHPQVERQILVSR